MSLLNKEIIEEEIVQEPMYQDVEEEYDEHSHQNNFYEVVAKLSGAILRKAEFENDFDKVYSLVFEKIASLAHGEDFLAVLGEVGG